MTPGWGRCSSQETETVEGVYPGEGKCPEGESP